MHNKLSELNEAIIEVFANSIQTVLATIGFLVLYPLVFVGIFSSVGCFIARQYLWGLGFLMLTFVCFYAGKGISKYLEKHKDD